MCDCSDLCRVFNCFFFFFFSSRRRHTRCSRDWSSDVCSSDLEGRAACLRPTRGKTRRRKGGRRRGVRVNRVRGGERELPRGDRKSTRLNSSHGYISYAVFCLKKKKKQTTR